MGASKSSNCLVATPAGQGTSVATMPLKDVFDQPETMWMQFRRRLDPLQPFCRITGHTSEEVREILAALENVYREPFPQLNLRQWSGAISTWLTHPLLDPTNSGRVVMDYVMKLVTTTLEWSYAAGEAAAELLTLRRDAIRVIDGTGSGEPAASSMPGPAVARKPWRSCRGHHDRHLDQARVQAASSPINSSLPAPGCGLLCHSRSTVSGWRPRWLLSPGAFVLHVLAFPMSPLGKESSAAGGIVLP